MFVYYFNIKTKKEKKIIESKKLNLMKEMIMYNYNKNTFIAFFILLFRNLKKDYYLNNYPC